MPQPLAYLIETSKRFNVITSHYDPAIFDRRNTQHALRLHDSPEFKSISAFAYLASFQRTDDERWSIEVQAALERASNMGYEGTFYSNALGQWLRDAEGDACALSAAKGLRELTGSDRNLEVYALAGMLRSGPVGMSEEQLEARYTSAFEASSPMIKQLLTNDREDLAATALQAPIPSLWKGVLLRLVDDGRAERFVEEGLRRPRTPGFADLISLLPPWQETDAIVGDVYTELGFTEAWRVELCRRAATLPAYAWLTCDPAQFDI